MREDIRRARSEFGTRWGPPAATQSSIPNRGIYIRKSVAEQERPRGARVTPTGELLDAGLEGGSGALVEGNLLAPSQVIITQVVRSKITV